jgi:hypothetical protein
MHLDKVVRWGLAAVAGVGLVHSALATNVSELVPAMALTDQQLQIGSRTLRLPEGQWNYIAQSKGSVTQGSIQKIASTYTVYAMEAQGGRMRSGLVLTLPDGGFSATNWLSEPCKAEGYVYRDDFGGNFNTPECLLVYKRRSHLGGVAAGIYQQAQQWAQAQSVSLPGPVYEVVYTRYASTDYGSIRVFIPVKAVANDDAVVAWAQQLPAALRRFFANFDARAQLPLIPMVREVAMLPVESEDGRLRDVDAIPYINDKARQRYRDWLKSAPPRAFAISAAGAYAYTSGTAPADETLPSDPVERAVVLCNRNSKQPCALYAVDGAVVWPKEAVAVP